LPAGIKAAEPPASAKFASKRRAHRFNRGQSRPSAPPKTLYCSFCSKGRAASNTAVFDLAAAGIRAISRSGQAGG
jgi:hypothetical protein